MLNGVPAESVVEVAFTSPVGLEESGLTSFGEVKNTLAPVKALVYWVGGRMAEYLEGRREVLRRMLTEMLRGLWCLRCLNCLYLCEGFSLGEWWVLWWILRFFDLVRHASFELQIKMIFCTLFYLINSLNDNEN